MCAVMWCLGMGATFAQDTTIIRLKRNSKRMNNSLPSCNTLKGFLLALALMGLIEPLTAQKNKANNPIIFADVPDISIVRVNDNYYMSSTTMHMNPGVPIMKSKDLVNWKTIGYAYDTLANIDELNLANGKSTYGRGE